jgi:signal transduction histidine kinase
VQRKPIEVGAEVRQLSHDLHPPMLKEAGLPETLRVYCEEFSGVRNIPVSCHAEDSIQDLSRDAALALYRIAQEAMGMQSRTARPSTWRFGWRARTGS